MNYQWIAESQQLTPIIAQLQNSLCNALDTEFIKVDTLYPKLGVLQIHVNGQVYLIDGQLDLSAVWQALFNAKQNVFHACGEDIDLMYHYAGQRPLSNVFDTQVAMAFLGYGRQVSYQSALEQVLHVQVEKDQTRSDWLARPLSEQQERYAAIDVFYLQDLAQHLITDLKQHHFYDFVLEDCHHYCVDVAQQLPIEDIYLEMANHRYSSRQLMQLKQLAMWRENLAIELNQPRSFILKNHVIQQLLERTPKTMQQLVSDYQIKPAIVRHHGKQILQLLNKLPEPSQYPTRLPRPYRYRLEHTKDHIEAKIAQVSQELAIPADILMRKKWLSQLTTWVAQDTQNIDQLENYLRGWRYECLTLPLIDIIRQDLATTVFSVSR
ncbi:MAG: ribonuclease D [Acinetobacter sp.]|jgi:ribonuclease D|nr:MAG: ribonuclease D [Acinetobacter sp.]